MLLFTNPFAGVVRSSFDTGDRTFDLAEWTLPPTDDGLGVPRRCCVASLGVMGDLVVDAVAAKRGMSGLPVAVFVCDLSRGILKMQRKVRDVQKRGFKTLLLMPRSC
jgi:hypothetical protein